MMKNLPNLFILLFFLNLISCNENNPKTKVLNSNSNTLKSFDFKQEQLNCTGEQFNADECFDNEKKLSITFKKEEILFQYNNKAYPYSLKDINFDLGHETYLFSYGDEKIVLVDSFLENGHLFFAYYINAHSVKLLGKKEVIYNEEDDNSTYNFKVKKTDKEVSIFLNFKLGTLSFDLKEVIDLSIFTNKNNKLQLKKETNTLFTWKGSYKITAKIISQFDNKETDVLYSITVESDQKAILSIGADNVQDYWCEGEYHLIKKDNILHAKGKCDQDDMDDFYLKNEDGKYYIKSKRFSNQDWQQLQKN